MLTVNNRDSHSQLRNLYLHSAHLFQNRANCSIPLAPNCRVKRSDGIKKNPQSKTFHPRSQTSNQTSPTNLCGMMLTHGPTPVSQVTKLLKLENFKQILRRIADFPPGLSLPPLLLPCSKLLLVQWPFLIPGKNVSDKRECCTAFRVRFSAHISEKQKFRWKKSRTFPVLIMLFSGEQADSSYDPQLKSFSGLGN